MLSIPADVLNVGFDIYFDPIVPLVTVQANVQAAMDEFLSNLPFNGAFNITALTDAIQESEGVVDPRVSNSLQYAFRWCINAICC